MVRSQFGQFEVCVTSRKCK